MTRFEFVIMILWRLSLIGILVAAMLQNMVAIYLFGLATIASIILQAFWEINAYKNRPPRK